MAKANSVAFGGWRCNCTMLAKTFAEIPPTCPVHSKGLLGPISWETNPRNVALGFADPLSPV